MPILVSNSNQGRNRVSHFCKLCGAQGLWHDVPEINKKQRFYMRCNTCQRVQFVRHIPWKGYRMMTVPRLFEPVVFAKVISL